MYSYTRKILQEYISTTKILQKYSYEARCQKFPIFCCPPTIEFCEWPPNGGFLAGFARNLTNFRC